MIKYALNCTDGHAFESWFGSSADFDRLHGAGMISCAVCGSTRVEKAVMAPRVTKSSGTSLPDHVSDTPAPDRPLSAPASVAEQAVAELRRKIEASSENVGERFVEEARRIHNGEAPERSIIGQAKVGEAKKLIDDGIPVAPLPWGNRKTN